MQIAGIEAKEVADGDCRHRRLAPQPAVCQHLLAHRRPRLHGVAGEGAVARTAVEGWAEGSPGSRRRPASSPTPAPSALRARRARSRCRSAAARASSPAPSRRGRASRSSRGTPLSPRCEAKLAGPTGRAPAAAVPGSARATVARLWLGPPPRGGSGRSNSCHGKTLCRRSMRRRQIGASRPPAALGSGEVGWPAWHPAAFGTGRQRGCTVVEPGGCAALALLQPASSSAPLWLLPAPWSPVGRRDAVVRWDARGEIWEGSLGVAALHPWQSV
eukprot:scaffold49602_cov63-Phaeocystis_antarctica.AAC.10